MNGNTTRHISLTVTAHLVDVYDSDTPGQKPNKLSSYAVSTDTRPCYSCVGVPLGGESHLNEHERAAVRACLDEAGDILKVMLSDASACIMDQAAGWKAGDQPRCNY